MKDLHSHCSFILAIKFVNVVFFGMDSRSDVRVLRICDVDFVLIF